MKQGNREIIPLVVYPYDSLLFMLLVKVAGWVGLFHELCGW